MDIFIIGEEYIEPMVRIWNNNLEALSAPGVEKKVDANSLNEMREGRPTEFYGVIVEEDINDELGGFFVLEETDDAIILDQMAIDDKYKRKGVGDAILRYCKYQAKENYNNNLELRIYAHNVGGINFFFDQGLKIDKYDSDNQEYTMIFKD